jgi:hypothetical protein
MAGNTLKIAIIGGGNQLDGGSMVADTRKAGASGCVAEISCREN